MAYIFKTILIFGVTLVLSNAYAQSELMDSTQEQELKRQFQVQEKFLLLLLAQQKSVAGIATISGTGSVSPNIEKLARNRPVFKASLNMFMTNPKSFNVEEKRDFFANITADPDNDLSIRLLVAGLYSQDSEVRKRAKLELLTPDVRSKLDRYSVDIELALNDFSASDESSRLLALVDLSENTRKKLLESSFVGDDVKARLGDSDAEARVIEKFLQAKDSHKETYAFSELLFVGTGNALRVFFDELQSTRTYENFRGNEVSVAFSMVKAYGKYNPSELLFQPVSYKNNIYIDENEFSKTSHQRYLRSIEKFMLRKYDVKILIEAPFLIKGQEVIEEYKTVN